MTASRSGRVADTAQRADEQILLRLVEDWAAAGVRDAATLRRILDERFIVTIDAGTPQRRDAFIRLATEGPQEPPYTHALADPLVIVAGDTAVVLQSDHMVAGPMIGRF